MLAIERRNSILSKVMLDGKVVVADMAQEFGVTEETIRRDLEKLDSDGLVHKTYGGAVKVDSHSVDLPYRVRTEANVDEKKLIAEKIADMVNDGDIVMIDSSSTAMCALKYLLKKRNLTIITNSIGILFELCEKQGWRVLSSGGSLKEGALALIGSGACEGISKYHADIAICSCKGVNTDGMITESNEPDADIKRAFFASAKKRVIACDSSKFGVTAFVNMFKLSDVDIVITDKDPGDEWQAVFGDTELVF